MKQVRAALIGFGGMGSQYAEIIYGGKVEGLLLTGICCRNKTGQETIKRLYPDIAIYGDSDEMFQKRCEFDALIIVTPHDTHVPLGLKAVGYGLHVLCDKPLGVSASEVKLLMSAADEAGVRLGTIFNTRGKAGYQAVKRLVDEGELGEITRAVWVCNAFFRSPAYHNSAAWRSTWAGEHGGLLVNQCQHYLDIWQWIFGMPDFVDALVEYGKFTDILVDDSVDVRLSYRNGLRGNFISSSGENPGVNRLELWGTKGRLTVEDGALVTFEENRISTKEFNEVNQEIYGKPEYDTKAVELTVQKEPYSCIFQGFVDSILGKGDMLSDGQDGLNTLTLANAAYLSSWLGKGVELPLDDYLYSVMLEKKIKESEL